MRANLVNKSALAGTARELSLGRHLILGPGELKSGGRDRDSILADALEAVIGAIAIDSGFDAATDVVLRLFASRIADLEAVVEKDPKTRLQELLQSRRLALPRYEVVSTEGSAHARSYRVQCVCDELGLHSRIPILLQVSAVAGAGHTYSTRKPKNLLTEVKGS